MATVPSGQPFCKESCEHGYQILYSAQVAFEHGYSDCTNKWAFELFKAFQTLGGDGVVRVLEINKGLLDEIYFSCNHNMESNINKLKIL